MVIPGIFPARAYQVSRDGDGQRHILALSRQKMKPFVATRKRGGVGGQLCRQQGHPFTSLHFRLWTPPRWACSPLHRISFAFHEEANGSVHTLKFEASEDQRLWSRDDVQTDRWWGGLHCVYLILCILWASAKWGAGLTGFNNNWKKKGPNAQLQSSIFDACLPFQEGLDVRRCKRPLAKRLFPSLLLQAADSESHFAARRHYSVLYSLCIYRVKAEGNLLQMQH